MEMAKEKEKEMAKAMLVLELQAFEPMSYAHRVEVWSKGPKDRERPNKTIFDFSFDVCHFSFESINPRKSQMENGK